ncbi:tetratricopeptide repeat protein [Allokutzneria sp. A3M-2-11 16]|uniref:AfsR/SARP family transcriptional regulator n=1 Tax=Allokutzneria sp. A3M-2-11 16 TaxID=2962043 RepID=UPI0020B788D5|nr:BTAD domain-containing putative transcriptional regulator [Allokutzneria sp. A3M-2-11 16]MCP3802212.1 tetratricopeptide repeat protein [Allokutzneria sp. A3M-2-11 16]
METPRFRLLGPLEVRAVDGWRGARAAKQRSVLALLLLHANQVVSVDRLVAEVWPEDPPGSAVNAVQVYVHQIRQLLGGPGLFTRSGGYALDVGPGELDAECFAQLAARGRAELDRAEHDRAVATMGEALALWRGTALADVPQGPTVSAERTRLEELRWSARQTLVDARLGLGHYAEVIGELRALTTEQPLNEGHWARLMTALYGAGRQADALEAYRQARETLVHALAVEPGERLRRRHADILAGVPAAALVDAKRVSTVEGQAPRVVELPAELPGEPAGFTGREEELALLERAVRRNAQVVAIDGPAGVGKTALAVHFGHRTAARFPDGQLYVDLHGYSSEPPMSPEEAIGRFLRSLGVPDARVPTRRDEAAAMLRSTLTGKRLLLVLDNARGTEQVRPMLPGTPGCTVLVTSRSRLGGLVALNGAESVRLGMMSPETSLRLLERLIGADLVRAEAETARELAHRCGHLPLALRVACGQLLTNAHDGLADLVERLSGAERLAALEIPDDPHAAVRTAFERSYQMLEPDERMVFRRLGLIPGADFSVAAAACVSPGPADRARTRTRLRRLVEAHLVEEVSPGRYRLHDLLREYAAQLVAAEDGEDGARAVLRRLVLWSMHSAWAAVMTDLGGQHSAASFAEPDPDCPPEAFGTIAEAFRWLDAEQDNLVACVVRAESAGLPELAWQFAVMLAPHFDRTRDYQHWITANEAGLRAARRTGRPDAEVSMVTGLGNAAYQMHRLDDALRHHRRALELSHELGKARGVRSVLHNIGGVYLRLGRMAEAEESLRRSLELSRELDDPGTAALSRLSLGELCTEADRPLEALDHFADCLKAMERLDNRWSAALARLSLAEAQARVGTPVPARANSELALAQMRELGSEWGEAAALRVRGLVHRAEGRSHDAMVCCLRSSRMFHDSADRYQEALSTVELGRAFLALDRPEEAERAWREALAIYEEIGSPRSARVHELLGG